MAILCNANWLLVQLLDYCKFLSEKEEFLAIKFFKEQGQDDCKVVYTDGNDKIVFTIMLEYTDFPLHNQFENKKEKEAILFFFRNNVLYLASEH